MKEKTTESRERSAEQLFDILEWFDSPRKNWFLKIFSLRMGIRWWQKWHAAIFEVKFGNKTQKKHRIARTIGWATHWHFGVRCANCGRQRLRYYWGPFWAYSKMHQWDSQEAAGDQVWSSKIKVVCMPSPPQVGNEVTCCCSTIYQNNTSTFVSLQGWSHCGRRQCCSIQVLQKSGVTRSVRFLSCRHAYRDATRGQCGTPIWKQTSHWLFNQ